MTRFVLAVAIFAVSMSPVTGFLMSISTPSTSHSEWTEIVDVDGEQVEFVHFSVAP